MRRDTLRQPARKLAARTWPVFDDTKHRWDEFKARTVNMARRAGHSDREVALALHDVLPGDAVVYLDQRGVSNMDLDDMIWHLDLLYRTRTDDPEMAQIQHLRQCREQNTNQPTNSEKGF
eukprot:GHVU01133184.1.p1 GENE.GHVU01133184.1~~GHVU01133184.1.p1  ORF type:complete len:120 (+),score=10.57 GHVU01133184.1:329-688(+)